MGLKHGPKGIGEDLENLSYFMPWAQVGTNKDYGMAQKHFLQQTHQLGVSMGWADRVWSAPATRPESFELRIIPPVVDGQNLVNRKQLDPNLTVWYRLDIMLPESKLASPLIMQIAKSKSNNIPKNIFKSKWKKGLYQICII